jgi:hypothetical protein
MSFLLLLACTGSNDDESPVEKGAPDELPLPDIEGIDFASAYEELFQVGLTVDLDRAWKGHAKTVELGSEGCPDFYAGPPPQAGDNVDEDAGGVAWQDRCKTIGDRRFSGWSWWDGSLERSGDEEVGITSEARRRLVGDGTVAYGDEVSFEFDGEASDSIYLLEAGDDSRWVYNSFVDATVTGSLPFGNTNTPGGWRTDLYLNVVGGNSPSLTARGNVYLFDTLVQDRFDSVVMDLALVSEAAAGPDDCTLEPLGTLSIRDTNAYWYDLVFLPRYADDTALDEDYSACDGCGTFYVRGQEQEEQVCIDLSFAFDLLEAPDPNDFVLSVRIP